MVSFANTAQGVDYNLLRDEVQKEIALHDKGHIPTITPPVVVSLRSILEGTNSPDDGPERRAARLLGLYERND